MAHRVIENRAATGDGIRLSTAECDGLGLFEGPVFPRQKARVPGNLAKRERASHRKRRRAYCAYIILVCPQNGLIDVRAELRLSVVDGWLD